MLALDAPTRNRPEKSLAGAFPTEVQDAIVARLAAGGGKHKAGERKTRQKATTECTKRHETALPSRKAGDVYQPHGKNATEPAQKLTTLW